MSTGKRKLADLRVCDLKDELEKRSLEITGNKTSLIERLQKALKDEGKNPDTHIFQSPGKRTPMKKIMVLPIKVKEEEVDVAEEIEEENGIVIDEVGVVDVVDSEEYEENGGEAQNDADMNENEESESLNLTIEEEDQRMLHAEDQDGKEMGESREDDGENANNSDVIIIKEEADDDEEQDYVEDDTAAEMADENNEETDANAEGEAENNENTEKDKKKDDSEQKSTNTKSIATKEDKDKTAGTASPASIGNSSTTAAGGKDSVTTAESPTGTSAANKKSAASSSRNLWVSGLSSLTRASDLKTIFSKYGKVIGAKVVTNTRTPGTRCYGYVTMASSADATLCIDHLHRTELHGRIISVERTKSEIGSSSGGTTAKKDDKAKSTSVTTTPPAATSSPATVSKEKRASKEKDSDGKNTNSTSDKKDKKPSSKPTSGDDNAAPAYGSTKMPNRRKSDIVGDRNRPNSRPHSDVRRPGPIRSTSRGNPNRRPSPNRSGGPVRRPPSFDRDRDRKRDVLSFQKIREERERQRQREREREMREEERRRRDFRRRQREEEERLAKEREKLRLERERLEREKAELLRLERERQKLEREKIELERLELKRQQMKIQQRNEDAKRSLKRPATDDRDRERDRDRVDRDRDRYAGHSETKRPNTDRRFEAPPPPRFDSSLARSTDKKRDDYTSSKRDDYKRDIDVPRHSSSTSYHSNRDTHKDTRYPIPDPPRSNFRRDDRDSSRNTSNKRYDAPSYVDRSGGGSGSGGGGGSSAGGGSSTQWHNSGPPAMKSFTNSQMSNNIPSWQTKSDNNINHWRPIDTPQDRYDRTYNERSGPYMDPTRQGGGGGLFVGGGGSGGSRPQDRYQISRYDNGKY